jgi:hypothetical protein
MARNQGTYGNLASIGRGERKLAVLDGLQHRLMDPARRDEERGWHMEEARPDHAGRASVNKADCGGLTTTFTGHMRS